MNCEFSCDAWGCLSLGMSWCRRDVPTSLPSGPCSHVYRLCPWGWWPLTASLYLALVDPLDAPQLQVKGCHVSRDSHLQSLWYSWGGSFQCQFYLSNCRSRDLRCKFLRLLRGQLADGGIEYGGIFWVGWDGGCGGMCHGSPQEPV